MKKKLRPQLLVKVLQIALVVGAAAYIAVFLAIAFKRSRYPYELEWMEGGMVDHVQWILSGKQLYVEPSLDFIPFTYTPFFFYLGALFAKVFGVGFFSLRLISILSTLGCFGVIFEIVRRETKSAFFGILAVGLFAATFQISGDWFDIGRVDMLFLFLTLSSFFVLRFYQGTNGLLIAGLLISLAFLTKQTALFLAIVTSVYCLIYLRGWKKIIYPATFAAVFGVSTLAFSAISGGWYTYYIFTLPRTHKIVDSQILGYWIPGISVLLAAFALSLAYLVYLYFLREGRHFGFYLFFLGGVVGVSWVISCYAGSYINDFIPAYAAISVCMGLGAHALASNLWGSNGESGEAGGAAGGSPSISNASITDAGYVQICFVFLLCLLQFLALYYHPRSDLPTVEDRSDGDRLVQLIKNTKGDVIVSAHGFLTTLAGKNLHAQGVAIGDVLYAGDDVSRKFQQEIDQAMKSRKFGGLVFDASWDADFGNENDVRKIYPEKIDIFPDNKYFMPVTGFNTRPEVMYTLPD